jgi:ribosomal protein L32
VDAPAPASCPKCGAPRRAERACPRCGLSADRMEAFARAREASVPEPVAAAWAQVLEAWDDAARHDALLRLVARHDAYAWAAAKYRDAKRAAPASPAPFRSYPDRAVDAIADRQLDRMRRAAEATLYAGATAREERGKAPYRAATAILAMLIFAVIAGLIFASVFPRDRPGGGGGPYSPDEAQPAPPAQTGSAPRK